MIIAHSCTSTKVFRVYSHLTNHQHHHNIEYKRIVCLKKYSILHFATATLHIKRAHHYRQQCDDEREREREREVVIKSYWCYLESYVDSETTTSNLVIFVFTSLYHIEVVSKKFSVYQLTYLVQ